MYASLEDGPPPDRAPCHMDRSPPPPRQVASVMNLATVHQMRPGLLYFTTEPQSEAAPAGHTTAGRNCAYYGITNQGSVLPEWGQFRAAPVPRRT